MKKYTIPKHWRKIDGLTVKAPDDSKVWLDIRGLVGLELPSGKYVSLGAYFADNSEEELHDGKFGPPPFDKQINISVEDTLIWWKDGHNTGEIVSKATHRQILDSIKNAMKTLGYTIEYK